MLKAMIAVILALVISAATVHGDPGRTLSNGAKADSPDPFPDSLLAAATEAAELSRRFGRDFDGLAELAKQAAAVYRAMIESFKDQAERYANGPFGSGGLDLTKPPNPEQIGGLAAAIANETKRMNELISTLQGAQKQTGAIDQILSNAQRALVDRSNANKLSISLSGLAGDVRRSQDLFNALLNADRAKAQEVLWIDPALRSAQIQRVDNTNGVTAYFTMNGLSICISTVNKCGGRSSSVLKS